MVSWILNVDGKSAREFCTFYVKMKLYSYHKHIYISLVIFATALSLSPEKRVNLNRSIPTLADVPTGLKFNNSSKLVRNFELQTSD